MGDTGSTVSAHIAGLQALRQLLAKRFALIPTVITGRRAGALPAVHGNEPRCRIINPTSQRFGVTGNRMRLSAAGTLYPCLGHDHKVELRPLLRPGITDEGLT